MLIKISILWLLFFSLHSILASESVKRFVEERVSNSFRFYRFVYNLISMIIFSAIVYLLSDFSNHHILFSVHPILKYLAWILLFSGIVILTWALYSYKMLDFTGINQLFGREEIHGKLITSGLNSIVRHPIYFAIILLVIGLSILYPTDLILLTSLFCIVYLYIGTTLEERKLIKIFGDEYKAYQKKVNMFIPFLF